MTTTSSRVPEAVSISAELLPLITSRAAMRVHSAFDRSLNLVLEAPAPAWLPLGMITLAHEGVGNLPNGILVRGEAALRGLALMGGRALLDHGRLMLDGARIDLSGAPAWDPSLDRVCARGRSAGWKGRWASAWHALTRAVGEAPASPLWGMAAERVDRLADALERRALGEAVDAARQLVGLGPGLTPSGDDLLVGVLVAMHCGRASAGPDDGFVSAFGAEIRAMSRHTTDVSRVFLEWAAHGRATQRLRDVVEAVVMPQGEGRLGGALDAALRVGSTSGADGLLGLLMGLRLWTHEREEDHANAA